MTDVLDGWVRERPTRRGYRNDAILAVVLAAGSLVTLTLYSVTGLYGHPPSIWISALWALALCGSLAFRRRWPATVALVCAAAFVAGVQLGVPEYLVNNICLFIAIYTLGAWGPDRMRAAVVRGVIIAGMFLWLFATLFLSVTQPDTLPQLSRAGTLSPFAAFGLLRVLTNLLYFGGAYYFGNTAYESAKRRATLQHRTVELNRARRRSAAQAVALERVRIARELHDVVAHHVSLMGVQAGAARMILQRDSGTATQSLEAIEASARSAVDELHKLLGTLREDPPNDDGPEPDAASRGASTRGVDQLTELVTEAQTWGLPAILTVVGDAREIADTTGLSIYRIAQEAVTNTRKHAGAGARVDMRLRYLPHAVELEVSDNGSRRTAASAGTAASPTTGGLGHIGMRERVAAVGGEIEIGQKPRGGYVVRARFPTDTAPRTTTTAAQS